MQLRKGELCSEVELFLLFLTLQGRWRKGGVGLKLGLAWEGCVSICLAQNSADTGACLG